MAEKPEPGLGPVEALQVTTPVIDIQDLEHHATLDSRDSNKSVRVEPTIDSDALRALKQMEKLLSGELSR